MNAEAFRHFYNYHFAENRKIWGHVAALTFEQFNARPTNAASSVAFLLTTGMAPGNPVQTGQMFVFGSGAEP